MKKILQLCLLWAFIIGVMGATGVVQAQGYDKNCFYGISFDISKNPNWGFGELVITAVEPNSTAEQAGIKVGDIVMEIDGKATYLRDNQTIADMLFGGYDLTTKFTIRNMNTYFKEYELVKKCLNYNTISEQQLSEMFDYYSLENTNEQRFTLAAHITPTDSVDYTYYHTYDFHEAGDYNSMLDKQITDLVERQLNAKGLIRDTKNPDIVVQTYYTLLPNSAFTSVGGDLNHIPRSWRYDMESKEMVPLPIYANNDAKAKYMAQYVVEFGFAFYDKKHIKPGTAIQIWDCEIKDYLFDKMTLTEYVKFHVPLMLMHFPFEAKRTSVDYQVKNNKYNYTGIYFDRDDLSTVRDIDEDSPAYKAGIREGYVVRKIDGRELGTDRKSILEVYEAFKWKTAKYRTVNSPLKEAGRQEPNYSPWNMTYRKEIEKAFAKKSSMAVFSYLYKYENYIDPLQVSTIRIEAWDGYQFRNFNVVPEIRQTTVVRTF